MKKVDVLVVGAGPGGSAAAKKCVDNGLKTLLIERRRLPRRKACSGIIDNLAQNYVLENFGPIPAEVFGEPHISRGMAFYFPSVGTILADVDCFMPYVWRHRFDHWLARTSGAELRDETRFLCLEEKEDHLVATLNSRERLSRCGPSISSGLTAAIPGSFAPLPLTSIRGYLGPLPARNIMKEKSMLTTAICIGF